VTGGSAAWTPRDGVEEVKVGGLVGGDQPAVAGAQQGPVGERAGDNAGAALRCLFHSDEPAAAAAGGGKLKLWNPNRGVLRLALFLSPWDSFLGGAAPF
jgi:hypothetical protein